ncbi:PF11855 domain protein [Leptospira interrogans serovar Bataviae str. HAI135]|nr:PF11855 domain protein [Leptospira interrogans serovar Bataviae str. HAI135]
MDYNLLQRLFRSSSIRLLKKDNAPFIIYFLEKYFRGSARIFVPFEELKILLHHELENFRELEETFLSRTAEVYIGEWVSENFLSRRIRSLEGSEEIILEPSSELEKVFSWMDDLRSLENKESIGTETRFFSVLNKLKEIVEESVSDPKEKLDNLNLKRRIRRSN